jgi:hypothetical protein
MRSVVVSMCTSTFCISARSVRYTPTPINVQDRIVWATALCGGLQFMLELRPINAKLGFSGCLFVFELRHIFQ